MHDPARQEPRPPVQATAPDAMRVICSSRSASICPPAVKIRQPPGRATDPPRSSRAQPAIPSAGTATPIRATAFATGAPRCGRPMREPRASWPRDAVGKDGRICFAKLALLAAMAIASCMTFVVASDSRSRPANSSSIWVVALVSDCTRYDTASRCSSSAASRPAA